MLNFKRQLRLFAPILAGSTIRERMIASLGALIGIGLTGTICGRFLGHGAALPMIVAPMGASAVLLFAVPASPLAQPWPIIGGNTISALIGVIVAHLIHDPMLATGVGVSVAIAAMSFTRSLHPPGGAAALTAVLGGPAVTASGFLFPFMPVALNSVILVALGYGFHRLSRRSYPHLQAPAPSNPHQTIDPPPQLRAGFQDEDIDAALGALAETYDIDRADIDRLLREVELRALARSHGRLSCSDIMSRDVITIGLQDGTAKARSLLIAHNIRTLPVVDRERRLLGIVGLRELVHPGDSIGDLMSTAVTAAPDHDAFTILPALTDGRTHAVVITNQDEKIVGLITQTDLLTALARTLPLEPVSYDLNHIIPASRNPKSDSSHN